MYYILQEIPAELFNLALDKLNKLNSSSQSVFQLSFQKP